MGLWALFGVFTAVAAVCCVMGFKKFVWFLSIGYGASVFGLGIAYLVYGFITGNFDILSIVQCVLFAVYGFRLSGFLAIREFKNAAYKKVLDKEANGDAKMPVFVLVTIWVMVAVLYVMQTSPVLFRIFNDQIADDHVFDLSKNLLPIIGLVISLTGVVLEAVADKQKSSQKKENPKMVAKKGLYKMCRCPNYFGEIVFWTGVFVAGISAIRHAPDVGTAVAEWIISILGYICIVYIMINGAQRLDRRQEKNYGTSEEYRSYADHTPLIIPLIPVSHIGKYKVEDMEAIARAKAEKKAAKEAKK